MSFTEIIARNGTNVNTVHPNCRCTTVGWDEVDEDEKLLEGQKQLTYEEWKKFYVDDRVEIELPKQPEPPAPVVPAAQNAAVQSLTTGADGGIISSGKVYSFDDYLSNPMLLAESTPKQKYDFYVANGNRVIPYLGRGNFKKVPYEQGGGYRIFFDQNQEYMLQYHPEDRSHHEGAYYKLSSGGKPKRYRLDGTEIID